MSRVLIWKQTAPGCEYDIFTPTDYNGLYDHVQSAWNGVCKNWGNRLWFQGIYSAIDTGENEYYFITDNINIDEINSSYDMIVLPMANIFYHGFVGAMRELTAIFEKIRIPTYVIVCGVQADSYDALNDVVDSIGKDSARFIRAIYNTGGEFALRGYFTKEFFERLGFSSAVVTGCPSLYQMGPDFKVTAQKSDELTPVFNGHIKPYAQLLAHFSKSAFIDQDEFFEPLFQPNYLQNPDLKFQMNFVNKFGAYAARLLAEGRIIIAADMNDWSNYLKNNGFNYAFGSRIHGTIMALLSGIPATIVTTDSRTQEMAEFFDIPRVNTNAHHSFGTKEFYALYEKMDYSGFNRTFKGKFHAYEQFLQKCGIVSHVNTNNSFFTEKEPCVYTGSKSNHARFAQFAQTLDKNARVIKLGNLVRNIAGKVR